MLNSKRDSKRKLRFSGLEEVDIGGKTAPPRRSGLPIVAALLLQTMPCLTLARGAQNYPLWPLVHPTRRMPATRVSISSATALAERTREPPAAHRCLNRRGF